MNTLAQYLSEKNITQADFAERVGVTQPVISRICKGRNQPGADLAHRIHTETDGAVPFYAWPQFSKFRPEAAE